MSNFLKKSLLCILAAFPLMLLFAPSSSQTPKKSIGFSLKAIASTHPHQLQWETRALSAVEKNEVEHALAQDYRYLGSGGQCFSFVSRDERYVIKFFKQKKFAIPNWIERFPLPFLIHWIKDKKVLKAEMRRDKVFSAFRLCFDAFPDETGLFYVHLNQTNELNKMLSVTDTQGNPHTLNLDDLQFVLQKKAELAYNAIDNWVALGQSDRAKAAIDQLLALNIAFYQKGLRNRDANFRSNCGFIGSKAILIDVGRVVYSEEIKNPENYKKDLLQITPRFRKYLASKHPDLLAHFDESIMQLTSKEVAKIVSSEE